MAVKGVLSSCEIFAKKSDLNWATCISRLAAHHVNASPQIAATAATKPRKMLDCVYSSADALASISGAEIPNVRPGKSLSESSNRRAKIGATLFGEIKS